MLPALLFTVGLLVGPLLGIVVDRAVGRERLVPDHRCPTCQSSLGGLVSLVPVASWFRRCPTSPSHSCVRYPLVDLSAAVALAVAGWRFGASWELGPYALLFLMLVVMSVIDLETHLLLDNLTKPTLIAGILLVLFLSGLYGAEDRIWPALIGSALFGGILLLAYRVYPPGLGFGDVKLAPSLGLFVGWLSSEILVSVRLVFFTMIVAFAIGGFGGLAVNLIRRRRAEFPLGPALAVGTVAVIALSSPSVSDLLQQ